jgi:thioredoxin 1
MTFVTQDELRERLGNGRAIVADFTADWCPPCRAVAPELDILEAKYTDIDFVKIDADTNPELTNELGILGIPTIVKFSPEGQEVARTTGAVKAEALALRLQLEGT